MNGKMNGKQLKVLIAEHSLERYQALMELFIFDPNLNVAGWAKSSAETFHMTETIKPDLVLIDEKLPELGGLATTRRLVANEPTPVIVLADSTTCGDENKVNAYLRAGALAVLERPTRADAPHSNPEASQRFLESIHNLAQVRPIRLRDRETKTHAKKAQSLKGDFDVVAIASSTGGPQCLAKIFAQVTPQFPLPIVVVQHISSDFIDSFISWLNNLTLAVVERARSGQHLLPGHIYICASSLHLAFDADRRIRLLDTPPVNGFKPSATIMFESLAESFGGRVLAFILTGMGSDGVDGLRHLAQRRATIIAQDEHSSAVYGMPKAAMEAGFPIQQMSLIDICRYISKLT